MQYLVRRDGQTYGPYTLEDLERYLASGNIQAIDEARSDEADDETGWEPVGRILGLQPAVPAAASGSAPTFRSFSQPTALVDVSEHAWFPVAPAKFVVMSLCTFGLYHVYWAYMNWSRYRRRFDRSVTPWARAILLGIWNFPLFDRVKDAALEKDIAVGWNPIALGIGVLVLAVCSRLPSPWYTISFLSFLPYLPVVATIEKINQADGEGRSEGLNARFTPWNIACIVVGGLLLILSVANLITQHFQK